MKSSKAAYLEGIVSIVVNVLLFALKFWAGKVSMSVALMADAWHSLSDSVSSVIVILGAKLSSKKADKEHPFGHGRWEQIAAIFIGFLLGLVAYDILIHSMNHFREKTEANFGTLALVVIIISILVKEGLAQYAFYLGRKTGNTSVKADGWHHRTDSLSSVVLLIGILLKNYFWWIDSVLGFLIALLLFYAVYQIVREAINKLLGEKPSENLIIQVKEIVNSHAIRDLDPHHFHIHRYGEHKELTFHIRVCDDCSLREAHNVASVIEQDIRENLNVESTIHLEPTDKKHD